MGFNSGFKGLKCTRFKTDLIFKYFIHSTTFSKHIRTSKWLHAFHDLLLSTFPSLMWPDWLQTSIWYRQWKRPCHHHLAPTQVMLPTTACYIDCVVTTIILNPMQKQIQCKGIIADRGRTHGDWSSAAGEMKQRQLKKSTPVPPQTSEGTLVPAGKTRSDL